jgi:hypothetical protein
MEQEIISDPAGASSFLTALLEYGAMGLFAAYLIATNWFAQKRIDKITDTLAYQLTEHTTKLDALLDANKAEKLERDIKHMVEAKLD